jgi:two-component system, NarL family, nitrate/nitrite response regulator NarL
MSTANPHPRTQLQAPFYAGVMGGSVSTVGHDTLPPTVAERLQVTASTHGRRASGAARPLTARQVAILGLLAIGYPNKTIATELGISISAVGSHIAKLATRYGVCGRAGIVGAAAELGELPRRRLDVQRDPR